MRYTPPIITTHGELEREGNRARVRCHRGHYVLSNGDAAPLCGERPAPMTVDDATRAIVLHRRQCETGHV